MKLKAKTVLHVLQPVQLMSMPGGPRTYHLPQ